MMNKTVGTPAFLSPEICAGLPYHGRAADVWALGICLYMFVFGTSLVVWHRAHPVGVLEYSGWEAVQGIGCEGIRCVHAPRGPEENQT